jgi:hypothetical protein
MSGWSGSNDGPHRETERADDQMVGNVDHPNNDTAGSPHGQPRPGDSHSQPRFRRLEAINIEGASLGPPHEPVSRAAVPVAPPLAPDFQPRTIRTKTAHSQLIASGMSAAEATALIGYVSGLRAGRAPWTLAQINRLLFLRELYASHEWGDAERRAAE